ncbi:hypothetical protein IQ265_18825 [Nodosilinea sp. LEGE 06152]|uniref:hypothetical protein n=1 Tax=Nodosilinea sp. LEGE 06152 TaxID=2777966 RepID=UPI00187E2B35|nr:hypothetical protein [Nodosilinea sp. LEGE 06152]MBE9158873.1 hypothetical protein [Nodosilinea sp. LEGE 06152]
MIKSTFRLSALLPLGLTLLLTTAACTRTSDSADINGTDPMAAPVDPVAGDQTEDTASLLALSGEGLQLVGDQSGSTDTLAFGTDMAVVEDAVTELVGEPAESGENTECGSGPQMITQWSNGLVLHAADGEFIGWSTRPDTDANLTTIAGVGIGSTRGELESAYTIEVAEGSLGTEFSTGDLFGILSSAESDATVENLWAGTVCNFR